MKRKRVLLAGLFHETHTFLPGRTTLADFLIRHGRELLTATGDASPVAGVIEESVCRNWELIPLIDYRALPGPKVENQVFEQFWDEFKHLSQDFLVEGVDGICLVLHGAMVTDIIDDVEGEFLQRIRSLAGAASLPLAATLDLHGNVTVRMAQFSDLLVAYEENPHTDARDTAKRTAALLDLLMVSGKRASTVWVHPRIIWPPTGTGTANNPMRLLEQTARRIKEENPDMLAVNVFAGFSFADVGETGVSFTASTIGNPAEARLALEKLANLAVACREQGCSVEPDLNEIMARLKAHEKGPILLVEPSDNIGGGSPGDGTTLLRAFIDHSVQNAAVIINDPDAVADLERFQPGDRAILSIGGKGSSFDPGPVTLEVELISKSDGVFVLEDKHSHLASMLGCHIDMGSCAVVRHKGVTVLLTSKKTPPFDLGQWRSQGLHPEQFFAIGVKAAVAHQRAYAPIAKASYNVDTPGPCSSNLRRLNYVKVNRPTFPLDDVDPTRFPIDSFVGAAYFERADTDTN